MISGLTAASFLCAASLAWSHSAGQSATGFRKELAAGYEKITRAKKWDPREDRRLKLDLRKLTTAYTLNRLNQRTPLTPESFERELNEDFAHAIGGMPLEDLRKYWGDVKYASALATKRGRSDLWVVGYEIPHANTSLVVIQVFGRVSGVYHLLAESGGELENCELRLIKLKSFAPGEMRFLAFGKRLGANQTPINAVVYDFDGKSIKALWRGFGLRQGNVETEGDKIVLTYQDPVRYEKGTPPYFVREVYKTMVKRTNGTIY